ncbi:hypothetical protein RF11_00832 [Thelohanellus kitauei]|uniref:Uncharacterized protein n=1 Tax=Thelohanellus kitauei TaxID=669202 RepID=A0A0C2MAT4_THEKT|nr:hypothetical protein RF11_00832 [Thelohanellus kitauei]
MMHFGLNYDQLVFFALSCGNDFFDSSRLGHLFPPNVSDGSNSRIIRILMFVKQCRTPQHGIRFIRSILKGQELHEFVHQVDNVLNSYNIRSTLDGFSHAQTIKNLDFCMKLAKDNPKFSYQNNFDRRAMLDSLYHRGEFCGSLRKSLESGVNYLTLPPQNFDLYSVNDLSANIREVIYKFVHFGDKSKVLEFDRIRWAYKPKNDITVIPFKNPEILAIKNRTREYFLMLFSLSLPNNLILDFTAGSNVENASMFLLSAKYVRLNTRLNYDRLVWKALVLGWVRNAFLTPDSKRILFDDSVTHQKVLSSNLIHLIGEYTTTVTHLHALGALLNNPIPVLPYLYWFDGPLVVDTFLKISESIRF